MENDQYLLRMVNIEKTFPGVRALKGVNLNVKRGEVHALVGENGAGKSTLMKCLIGIQPVTSGEIIFDGEYISKYNTADALNMGISMIHQELSPVAYRPIMENIWLGREPLNKFGLVDHQKMYEDSKAVLDQIDLQVDPKTLMVNLTVAQMQMVEIAKAISYNAKLIIMDEPSSSLTEREEQQLFSIIHRLKAEGRSIIYISHRLAEIFEVADRVTVFRDGANVGEADVKDITTEELIAMMVGRKMDDMFPKIDTDKEGVVLEVKNLSHRKYFHNVSFTVRKGEILGFAGLVGAGRTEVMETIYGIRPHTEGQIFLHGQPVEIHNPGEAINMGISFLTEDRRGTGIFPLLSIDTNIAIPNYDKYLTKLGLVDQKAVDKACAKYVEAIQIKTPSLKQKIMNLSGGNQQKVLLARWLMTEPDVLILDEPTRGIDVGAKAEIYQLMSELADQGKCIIMVSSELPEVLGMSDRIVVMHEGKITGILDNGPDVTQEVLMRYATGTDDDF